MLKEENMISIPHLGEEEASGAESGERRHHRNGIEIIS